MATFLVGVPYVKVPTSHEHSSDPCHPPFLSLPEVYLIEFVPWDAGMEGGGLEPPALVLAATSCNRAGAKMLL